MHIRNFRACTHIQYAHEGVCRSCQSCTPIGETTANRPRHARTHTHTRINAELGGTMTVWNPGDLLGSATAKTYIMSKLSPFPRPSAHQSLSPFELAPQQLRPVPNQTGITVTLYHRDKSELCMDWRVCAPACACAICCSSLAVVKRPPCSICHSFGVEDKHTDENDSDHRTIYVWICLFPFTSWLYFSFFFLAVCLSFFLGG